MHKEQTRKQERARENPGGLHLPGAAKQGWVGMNLKKPKLRGREKFMAVI